MGGATIAREQWRLSPEASAEKRVHFEAPAATRLDQETKNFLDWFNTDRSHDPVLKAGLAQLLVRDHTPF